MLHKQRYFKIVDYRKNSTTLGKPCQFLFEEVLFEEEMGGSAVDFLLLPYLNARRVGLRRASKKILDKSFVL